MKKNVPQVLVGAVMAGLLAGASAMAEEKSADSPATDQGMSGSKNGCQGKDSCQGKDGSKAKKKAKKAKAKNSCAGKDGCGQADKKN